MNRTLLAISALSACTEGYVWCAQQGDISFAELWAKCPRSDWVLWLAQQLTVITPDMGLDICRRGMTLVIESVRRGDFKEEDLAYTEASFKALEEDMPQWLRQQGPFARDTLIRAKHRVMACDSDTVEYHIYKAITTLFIGGSWAVRATEFISVASDLATPDNWGQPVDTPFARALADIVRAQFDVEEIEKRLIKSGEG